MEELPASKLATLSIGLPKESRTVRRIGNAKLTLTEQLLAIIADRLGLLVWFQTEDAKHKRNRPASILSELTKEEEKHEKPKAFKSAEEFKREWKRLMENR